MCTASWIRRGDGYLLFFSRDESRGRGRALPPRRHDLEADRGGIDRHGSDRRGIRALAPVDSDAGGTWLAANDRGLTVGLLNRYHAAPEEPAAGWRSRGHLVFELAASADLERATRRLESLDLRRFRPCTVLLVDASAGPIVIDWDGARRSEPREVAPPLVSSGYDAFGATSARGDAWRRLIGADVAATPERLLAFHQDHGDGKGPLSTCMHRDDAHTVSLTRVEVTAAEVAVAYADGAPCRIDLGPPLTLPRTDGR